MYAHFKKLDYFTTECIYSPNAYRGYVRELIKDLEKIRPSTIIDIIHSGESIKIDTSSVKMPTKMNCTRCGFVSSNQLCKACVLLEGLNTGNAKQAMGRKAIHYEWNIFQNIIHTLLSFAFSSFILSIGDYSVRPSFKSFVNFSFYLACLSFWSWVFWIGL